jgi:type II secretory pathway pseudopilin PulG
MREGGFTLVEIVIAVAIVAATVAAGFGISLGSRSLAVATAAGEFDQFLDSARTMARDLDGATLAFTPDAYGDGTEVRLLAGGPNGPAATTTLPTLHARATIEETESLGKAPFAFIVHANGSLSGRPGYRVGDTATNDVGCPPSGAFHFAIKAAGGSADRYVPCRMTLAANGPATLAAWPPATIAPLPTPCSGVGCTISLPNVPTSTPSCPPAFTAIPGGCAPGPPTGSGPSYHVTITGAPATITVGATGSLTAQATLTNANAVPAGTPASIPVEIQTADATCTATPTGWQPSGSAFTVTGTASGTCTLSAQANASAVPGAMADAASATVAVIGAGGATPTPAPPQCDLVTNGKCYHRIVDPVSQTFSKYVFPDDGCGDPNIGCVYVDSIKQILLQPPYGFQPPVSATDSAHELLFKVLKISGVVRQCQPYSYFSGVPAGNSIQWGGDGTGAPADAAVGWGKPATFATINHLITATSASGGFIEPSQTWDQGTNLLSLFETVASGGVSSPYSFTFWSSADTPEKYIQWYPDFPGCDAAGDPNSLGAEYGIASVALVLEIYQAVP